jgi:hypothetical protein
MIFGFCDKFAVDDKCFAFIGDVTFDVMVSYFDFISLLI